MGVNVDLPGIDLFRMDGQVAIVTGGSKGLGLAMAAGMASAGANIMLISRTGAEATEAAAAIAERYQVDAMGFEADVVSLSACEAAASQAKDKWDRIDILINSAGINIRGAIDEVSPEDFEKVMKTNVTGSWNMCRAVMPHMKQASYGRIINLASTLGLVGLANRTPYATSKGAVVQFTRALALELAHHGITCNAICPGPFLTEMNIPIADSDEAKKFIIGAVALERWGKLSEIQGSAMYLASPGASYTTGSMLTVDGGWTAR